MPLATESDRVEILRSLQLICRGSTARRAPVRGRLSTGIPGLDRLLPGGGLEEGSLVEWLGSGASVLALQGVRSALDQQQVWAVVDPGGEFYSPAAQGWGVPLESLLLLRPGSAVDAAWAVEQCLRSPVVAVTWIRAETLSERVIQRWKISAETGGGVGVLFRPTRLRRQASWADVRWQVESQPDSSWQGQRRLRVELLACRGAFAGGVVELSVNDATGHVCPVSAMANSATAVGKTG